MKREIDCLIATGSESLAGPQYLANSTIFALAKTLAIQGRKTAILVLDEELDPALVARDESDGIMIYRSAMPGSTLPALSDALGRPRILLLPNQLGAYDLLQTPGLDMTIWLGEDDLVQLGDRWVTMPLRFWADSRHVAVMAQRLTQQPVATIVPPLGPAADPQTLPPADPACIAVVGARPRDGIALIFALARQRQDLRFRVIDWPRLTPATRRQVFAHAADCGNIDWRRPEEPAALLVALAEAGVILIPAMEPIGHRDWIRQMRLAGRSLLGSDLGAVADLIGQHDRILPAGASLDQWLQHLDRLRLLPAKAATVADLTSSCDDIAGQFLADLP
jgi:hypothetical protein